MGDRGCEVVVMWRRHVMTESVRKEGGIFLKCGLEM